MNLAMFGWYNGGTWPYDGITFVPGHMVAFARQNHFQCTIGGHGASPWKSWASEWTHREILNNNDLTCSSYLFIILTCSNEDEIHFFFGKRFSLGSLFVGHFSEKYLENIKHVWWMNEEQSCKLRSKQTFALFPQLLQFTNFTSLDICTMSLDAPFPSVTINAPVHQFQILLLLHISNSQMLTISWARQ